MNDSVIVDWVAALALPPMENMTRFLGLAMILCGIVLLPRSNIRFLRRKLRKVFKFGFH